MSDGYELGLRLHSGVPVVDLRGKMEPAAGSALSDIIETLSRAGHYEIVVNIQRSALDGLFVTQALAQAARCIRAHCGHIDVVGRVEQLKALWRQQAEGLFRLAVSEECAIARIKRTPVLDPGVRCTARTRHETRCELTERNP